MPDRHPAQDQLAAFRLGKLNERELDEVERHIAECDTCCCTLSDIPDDSFVDLVRQAGSSDATLITGNALTWNPATAVTPSSLRIPSDLHDHPRYQIIEKLGHGAMGVVYKAQHRLMERLVALKILNHRLTDNPESVERFRREVKAAARLVHPNIVTAYDAEQVGSSHYLVMEFVPGISLARLIEEQGPMPAISACEYIRQAALGLQHAYERGMVHRDIKPQNLMVVGSEKTAQISPSTHQIKILDFGLARFASETVIETPTSLEPVDPTHDLTNASTLMGTPEYIAPEQSQSASTADIRADIYSLGCTFYFLLAGHAPFPHGNAIQKVQAHRVLTPRPLKEIRPDVPTELVQVIERMLAKDPADRFQTPAAVAFALARFVKSEPATPTQPTAEPPHAVRLGFVVSLIIALVIIGGLFIPAVQDVARSVLRTLANRGTLVIDADDEDVEIAITQAEQVMATEILKRGTSQVFELPAGAGEIEAKDPSTGLRTKTTSFQLKRNGRETFNARALLAEKPPGPKTETAFQPLFNGIDLEAWEGAKNRWQTANGTLICSQPAVNANDHAEIWTRQSFGNFELRFKARLPDGQAHAAVYLGVKAPVDGAPLKGLCLYVGGKNGGKFNRDPLPPDWKVADVDALHRVMRLNEFNDYYLKRDGQFLLVRINGNIVMTGTFSDKSEGRIGLIAYLENPAKGLETAIAFKDVQIRKLP
ncbi:MAG TPA: protein kinase [Gemmataceae bacterium]|nr:protein kinase [Gemmataceae bacterium]